VTVKRVIIITTTTTTVVVVVVVIIIIIIIIRKTQQSTCLELLIFHFCTQKVTLSLLTLYGFMPSHAALENDSCVCIHFPSHQQKKKYIYIYISSSMIESRFHQRLTFSTDIFKIRLNVILLSSRSIKWFSCPKIDGLVSALL
jgi:hypothetical protein